MAGVNIDAYALDSIKGKVFDVFKIEKGFWWGKLKNSRFLVDYEKSSLPISRKMKDAQKSYILSYFQDLSRERFWIEK